MISADYPADTTFSRTDLYRSGFGLLPLISNIKPLEIFSKINTEKKEFTVLYYNPITHMVMKEETYNSIDIEIFSILLKEFGS